MLFSAPSYCITRVKIYIESSAFISFAKPRNIGRCKLFKYTGIKQEPHSHVPAQEEILQHFHLYPSGNFTPMHKVVLCRSSACCRCAEYRRDGVGRFGSCAGANTISQTNKANIKILCTHQVKERFINAKLKVITIIRILQVFV